MKQIMMNKMFAVGKISLVYDSEKISLSDTDEDIKLYKLLNQNYHKNGRGIK